MKHEIEGSDLRACIDKAYDAGYGEAKRKSVEWLRNQRGFLLTELDIDNYIRSI